MLKPGEASGMAAAATAAVRQLAATVEDYPDLKADQVMRDLMRRTRDLEDEVSLMREGYNHAVELYNTRIRKIPDVLMAKLFRFNERTFFQNQQEP
jgi:LemA protein